MNIPQPPDPLTESNDYMSASWRLGYHDGYKQVDPNIGEATLIARSAEIWDHEIRLKVLAKKEDALLAQHRDATADLVPGYSRHSFGATPWLVAWFYLAVAIVAFIAEYYLTRSVLGEVFQSTDKASYQETIDRAIAALAVNLCLVGCSLKMLSDVISQIKRHSFWRSLPLLLMAVLTVTLCTICTWGASGLRQAVGQEGVTVPPPIVISTVEPTQISSHAEDDAFIKASDAAGFTFRWLSLALPVFSALAFAMATYQNRDFRKHERALLTLERLDGELPGIAESKAQIEGALDIARRYRKPSDASVNAVGDMDQRAVVLYRHGFTTGSLQLRSEWSRQPLYPRLLAKFNGGS